jgi:hypothetical protein
MKINTFVAIGVIALALIGVITAIKNAQFQSEKQQAGVAIAKDKAACELKQFALSEAEIFKYQAEKNSESEKAYQESKKKVEAAEKSCEALDDYYQKYGR